MTDVQPPLTEYITYVKILRTSLKILRTSVKILRTSVNILRTSPNIPRTPLIKILITPTVDQQLHLSEAIFHLLSMLST